MMFLGIWGAIKGFAGIVPAFVWKWLAIVVVALCIFFYGQIKGEHAEKVKCEAAAVEAQTAANNQDLQAEKDAHANDLEITNNLKLQKQVDDVAIENLKAQLAKRPAGAKCLYDKSDADPDTGAPASFVRLPAARPAKAGARNKKSSGPASLPPAGSGPARPSGE